MEDVIKLCPGCLMGTCGPSEVKELCPKCNKPMLHVSPFEPIDWDKDSMKTPLKGKP
jgi:hypothetical protein